jgi:ribonuclease H / adenosylcobalamin/alpha-ribazole phosphatase
VSTEILTRGRLSSGSITPRPSTPVFAHVDGWVGPGNPDRYAGVGVVIGPHPLVPGLTRELCMAYPCTGPAPWSNNAAEYEAVLVALRVLYRMRWRGAVLIRSDSQLVVKQYNGDYGCYEPALVELLEKLRRGAGFFENVALEWVPRGRNGAADALARRGLEAALRRSGRVAS